MVHLLFCILFNLINCLRFDILSTSGQGTVRCLEQFIPKNTITKGFVESNPVPFQQLDFIITDDTPSQNKLFSKLSLVNSQKFSFSTNTDGIVKFCFTATLSPGQVPGPDKKRNVYFHIDSGSVNGDIHPDSKSRFASMETEVTWLRTLAQESVNEMMTYDREDEDMNKVNESTKERVFSTASLSIFVLLGVGAWEVYYLYQFFKAKHLI